VDDHPRALLRGRHGDLWVGTVAGRARGALDVARKTRHDVPMPYAFRSSASRRVFVQTRVIMLMLFTVLSTLINAQQPTAQPPRAQPPTAASAQQPPAPSAPTPSRPGKVFLSGENPYISLRDTPEGPPLTSVSFWRIHWSPVGPGHVCYVTVGADKEPGAIRVVLYDNKKLLDYLTNEVLGTFNKTYIDRPFTPIGGARFVPGDFAPASRRETCQSEKYTIELTWRDLLEPGLVDIAAGSRPTNPFGITYLRIPAGNAEVVINGTRTPGTSGPGGSFLAFGETWIK
jgi:hypothetical protein